MYEYSNDSSIRRDHRHFLKYSTLPSSYLYSSLDFHHEIEELRSKLVKSNSRISQMEHEFMESQEYAECENSKLEDELTKLRDRYDR